MAVVTRDGRGMVIASVIETDRTDATYNLTVADFETYFVGEQRVLVHNCNKAADKFADRREPKSLQDQMALESAQEGAPAKTIIEGLNDPKFEGQNKLELKVESNAGKKSVVHFVEDPKTGERTDFKFKKFSDE